MEYYLAIKSTKLLIHASSQIGYCAKWKKPISKGYVLYDIIYIACSKIQNDKDKKD